MKEIKRQMAALVERIEALERANKIMDQEVSRYAQVFNHAQEGLILLNTRQVITEVNDTLLEMLDYDRRDLVGRRPQNFYSRKNVDVYSASPDHLSFEATFKTRSGRAIPMLFNRSTLREKDGRIAGFAAFLIDLAELKLAREELRKSEERYRQLSLHDSLTGLFNTRYLYSELDELTYGTRATNNPFSLVFMDMDNFKSVVDTYGHLNGSRALQEVARTIQSCLESPCFGVAYGGDEFVVVLPGYDKQQAQEKALHIKSCMKETTYLTGVGYHVALRASFGVATCPEDGRDRTVLLALADQAMFRVKEGGKDGIAASGSEADT